jgi:hypothetical protein
LRTWRRATPGREARAGRVLQSSNTTQFSHWKEQNMTQPYNGMPAPELTDVMWEKSKHSNPNGACVEVAHLPNGEIAVRNSRFPAGPALIYTRAEIAAFLAGAKDGEFDHVI